MKNITHKNKWMVIIPGILVIGAILLELLAQNSPGFTIFYVDRIFPIISLPMTFVSGLIPFSLGEVLLYLLVILVLILIVLGLTLIVFKLRKHSSSLAYFYKKYLLLLWMLIGIYSMIMVLNCFILYQYPAMGGSRKATDERTHKLIILRDYVVERANELAPLLDRDSNGNIVGYDDGTLSAKAIEALKLVQSNNNDPIRIDSFDRLSGYYPKYKYFINPAFFSQQHIMGYYFPFSMEANINGIMFKSNVPHTVCHELSHLKGYIREDEANFIAYLACMESDDIYFEYSALLSVLGYLDRDFFKAINEDKDIYLEHPMISDQVIYDDQFLSDEAWKWVDAHSLIDTETVHKLSNKFTETVLTTNGVRDGIKSYSRVVSLLLDYYSVEDIISLHN